MKAILAVDDNMGIGKDGKLPWKCQEDMDFFRLITLGQCVIMGSKTYKDCGCLPYRFNIIVSTKPQIIYHDNVLVLNTLDHKEITKYGLDDAIVIGGASLLKSCLDKGLIDQIFLSRIKGDYCCDTHIVIPTDFRKVCSLKISDRCTIEKYML